MSLQLIIQEIKVLGDLKVMKTRTNEEGEQEVEEQRRFRVKIGHEQFTSKESGRFASANQLYFCEPFSYFYDKESHLLDIEIFREHQFLDNSDLYQVLTAEVDLSDLTTLHGDIVESSLYDINLKEVGKIVLTIETFRKAQGFFQKVSSKIFFEAVKQQYDRYQATQAAKNIKNLMVNNTLADTLMTINTMTLICEKEDAQIFMKEAFIMVRYGGIKAFSSQLKIASKQNANWMDYLQFMKNQGIKFQFFFFHYDQLGNIVCKAKGEIRYVIFDETINFQTINLLDKRSNKYGVLMVKFNQKTVDKVVINNKIDKKIALIQDSIKEQIEVFNRYKFQNKFNNHILSEKMAEMELKAQQEDEEKQRPLNPQEKKKLQEHSKFIGFLQKEMIKIERQLVKREDKQKKGDRKSMFLPNIDKKGVDSRVVQTPSSPRYKKMESSYSTSQVQKNKFPRI